MSSGKLAAQSAHAISKALTLHNINDWWSNPTRTVLIMQARDEFHVKNIASYLNERQINTYQIIDEGVNEIEPHSITAMATDVVDKEDENIKTIFSSFKTYRDKYKVILEVNE